jgi:hypothetical protein
MPQTGAAGVWGQFEALGSRRLAGWGDQRLAGKVPEVLCRFLSAVTIPPKSDREASVASSPLATE